MKVIEIDGGHKLTGSIRVSGAKNATVALIPAAILTDEEELYDPINKLRKKYPNILKIEFKNKRSVYNDYDKNIKNIKEKSVLDLFEEFFLSQNNISLNEHERDIINEIIKEVNDETTNS